MNLIELFNIKNKKIIITGGTRGIGKKIVESLIETGAQISVVASNKKRLEDLKSQFKEIDVYKCDLSNENQILEFVSLYLKKNEYCDILINNAGIGGQGGIESLNIENFYDIFKVNLFAPFLLIKHLLPVMKKRKSGNILNIGSTLGTRAVPTLAAYASSKAALIHFTKCLSIEVAPFNIRVNCLSPGYCKTDLNKEFYESEEGNRFINNRIPLKKLLKEEEIVPIVRLMISNAGNYMTGSNIIVDGGVGNW